MEVDLYTPQSWKATSPYTTHFIWLLIWAQGGTLVIDQIYFSLIKKMHRTLRDNELHSFFFHFVIFRCSGSSCLKHVVMLKLLQFTRKTNFKKTTKVMDQRFLQCVRIFYGINPLL